MSVKTQAKRPAMPQELTHALRAAEKAAEKALGALEKVRPQATRKDEPDQFRVTDRRWLTAARHVERLYFALGDFESSVHGAKEMAHLYSYEGDAKTAAKRIKSALNRIDPDGASSHTANSTSAVRGMRKMLNVDDADGRYKPEAKELASIDKTIRKVLEGLRNLNS